jgi:transposase-like protein
MSETRKIFTEAEKVVALSRMQGGENVTRLADELGVRRRLLYAWRDIVRKHGSVSGVRRGRPPKGAPAAANAEVPARARPDDRSDAAASSKAGQRIAELERKIGQQELELDFLQRAWRRVREIPSPSAAPGATGSTSSSKK